MRANVGVSNPGIETYKANALPLDEDSITGILKKNMFKDNNLKVKIKDHQVANEISLSIIIILAEIIFPGFRLLFKFILRRLKLSYCI
ncbi:uncharacterized protein LOC110225270 [Arabidopsis lyrata subsp. lyrata]|uniref:uncharacterized protein LOC110225270 n=1 Tax=Arabidopsis lyrata subsp. lyrata TaxID=81972 RepID=UPI000A29C38F|nr:uncharacterized protein LOC110225270 [Arabidopsis lyrata subsp. lyrata]|eukprot:XP_020870236.1 uncharacterized protein LOC110225270 [Arabidopsis lyrata subsp. lyrata]